MNLAGLSWQAMAHEKTGRIWAVGSQASANDNYFDFSLELYEAGKFL
jgi:hypothetical protein